jgi:hypothetical protein
MASSQFPADCSTEAVAVILWVLLKTLVTAPLTNLTLDTRKIIYS